MHEELEVSHNAALHGLVMCAGMNIRVISLRGMSLGEFSFEPVTLGGVHGPRSVLGKITSSHLWPFGARQPGIVHDEPD